MFDVWRFTNVRISRALAFSTDSGRRRYMVHDGKTLVDARRRSSRSTPTAIILINMIVSMSVIILLGADILAWEIVALNMKILVDMKIVAPKTRFVDRRDVVGEILRGDSQCRMVGTLVDQVCFARPYTRRKFDPHIRDLCSKIAIGLKKFCEHRNVDGDCCSRIGSRHVELQIDREFRACGKSGSKSRNMNVKNSRKGQLRATRLTVRDQSEVFRGDFHTLVPRDDSKKVRI
jgi:hypothetical protein